MCDEHVSALGLKHLNAFQLDEEFRYLQRKKLVRELAEVRAKNIRFYSELAKFKVAKPHTILHVYKVLIDDLSGSNIECAALLLENCGRFLLRSEETSEKMKAMVRHISGQFLSIGRSLMTPATFTVGVDEAQTGGSAP